MLQQLVPQSFNRRRIFYFIKFSFLFSLECSRFLTPSRKEINKIANTKTVFFFCLCFNNKFFGTLDARILTCEIAFRIVFLCLFSFLLLLLVLPLSALGGVFVINSTSRPKFYLFLRNSLWSVNLHNIRIGSRYVARDKTRERRWCLHTKNFVFAFLKVARLAVRCWLVR